MPDLLHIQASPRGERSHSQAVARAFIDAYRRRHPAATVETWDLFSEPLPAFDGPALDAKYAIMGGGSPAPEQQAAWAEVRAVFDRFMSARLLVFSVPMWNFGIPYRLKQLIDVINQPGLTWSYSPDKGFSGLVAGRRAVTVLARAGAYPPGNPLETYDFQSTYLDTWLGFIGITDRNTVLVEPTAMGDADTLARAREAAHARAAELAARL